MIKILLIDSEKELTETISEYLRTIENIDSDICTTPGAALDMLNKGNYDLVISEYDLQGINGIQLLNEIRRKNHKIPFILFTGTKREEIIISALNSGVDYYLQKDSDEKSLLVEMAHIIRKTVEEAKEREKVKHLTRILSTIRNIVSTIENERNFNQMLKSVCDQITGPEGYENARIILLEKPGDILAAEHSGFGNEFECIMEWFKKGETTGCAKKALESDDIIISERCSPECIGCPFKDYHNNNGAMTKALVKDGRTLGIFSVTLPSDFIMDINERFLFERLARDLVEAIDSFRVMDIQVSD